MKTQGTSRRRLRHERQPRSLRRRRRRGMPAPTRAPAARRRRGADAEAAGWAVAGASPPAAGGTRSGLTIDARATVSLTSLKRPGILDRIHVLDGSTTILIWRFALWRTSRIRGAAVGIVEPRRGRLIALDDGLRRNTHAHPPRLSWSGLGAVVVLESRRAAEHDEDLAASGPRPGRVGDLKTRVRGLDPGEDQLLELVFPEPGVGSRFNQ